MSSSITTATTTSRPLPAPSARDLEIYKAYVILKHEQVAISHIYNISRPRISQIVGKVRRWFAAGGSPSDTAVREHLAQERLSLATKRLRLMRVIEKATYASECRLLQPQRKVKSRYHGTTEVWREETRDQAPEVNLPALKLLLRAVKELDNLESRHDQPTAGSLPAPTVSENQLLRSVFDLLCRWRSRAEASGHLPASANIAQFIAHALNNILGTTFDDAGQIAAVLPGASSSSANLTLAVSAPLTSLVTPTHCHSTTSETANVIPDEKISSKC